MGGFLWIAAPSFLGLSWISFSLSSVARLASPVLASSFAPRVSLCSPVRKSAAMTHYLSHFSPSLRGRPKDDRSNPVTNAACLYRLPRSLRSLAMTYFVIARASEGRPKQSSQPAPHVFTIHTPCHAEALIPERHYYRLCSASYYL